jgi:hypothetical protein
VSPGLASQKETSEERKQQEERLTLSENRIRETKFKINNAVTGSRGARQRPSLSVVVLFLSDVAGSTPMRA